jgi:hypothetical protein
MACNTVNRPEEYNQKSTSPQSTQVHNESGSRISQVFIQGPVSRGRREEVNPTPARRRRTCPPAPLPRVELALDLCQHVALLPDPRPHDGPQGRTLTRLGQLGCVCPPACAGSTGPHLQGVPRATCLRATNTDAHIHTHARGGGEELEKRC